MDNLFYQLAEWIYLIGVEVLVTLIAIAVIVIQKVRYRRELSSYYKDSPIAMLVIDTSTGELVFANRCSMQLLSIRRIGKTYYYPTEVDKTTIKEAIGPVAGNSFKKIEYRWSISDIRQINIDLAGRKIQFGHRTCWLLYVTPEQSSGYDSEQVKTSLRVARTSLDSLSELIYIKDNEGNLVDTNRAFDSFWKGRFDEARVDIDGAIRGRKTQRRWTTDQQGRGCLLETSHSTLLSDDGDILGSLGISHDVTDWYKMQQDLRDEMEKRRGTEIALAQRDTILQSLLESSPDAIALFNEDKVYEACNQAFADSIGVQDYKTLIGKRLEDVIPEHIYRNFSETDEKVLKEEKSLRYRDKTYDSNGNPRWFDVVKSPYKDPSSGATGVLLMARDVTDSCLVELQLEEINQELERLSFMDGLTQIANRRRFDEQLSILLSLHQRENLPLTVMLCDIDFFKDYNDNYGHQMGDETLKRVAQSFEKVLTRASDCVARYGGEEFAFIIPNTDHNGAQVLSRNIHETIKELGIKHKHSTIGDSITLSIGVVSMIPSDRETPKQLIEYADQALYTAKKQGRNQTWYHRL